MSYYGIGVVYKLMYFCNTKVQKELQNTRKLLGRRMFCYKQCASELPREESK